MNRKPFLFVLVLLLFCSFLNKSDKGNRRAFYECSEPLDIDSTFSELRPNQTYFYFDKNLKVKDLDTNSFVWMESNPKDYFTAYLINTTDSIFNANRQDGSLIMIQEAQNAEGEWQPIEYWVYSGCGNSYFEPLSLEPGKYVMIPIKEYNGKMKTKFRLKMKKDKSLFYSESFDGTINPSQFEKETKTVNGILYHGPASYLDK